MSSVLTELGMLKAWASELLNHSVPLGLASNYWNKAVCVLRNLTFPCLAP